MKIANDFKEFKNKIYKVVNDYKDFLEFIKPEIDEIFRKNKITISIMGQMKYGKSTFLNAYIFGDEILPTATTPMTAALTKISYGENIKYFVKFFTEQDLENLKNYLHSNPKELSEDEKQMLKENLEKAEKLLREENLSGKTLNVSRKEEIANFVGSSGKYVPITSMLEITFPKEELKEVDFVDTPGFNDPVKPREKVAEDFIDKSDVIILFLYASRAFDASDKQFIVNKLKSNMPGKLIIVINKTDNILKEDDSLRNMKAAKEKIKAIVQQQLNYLLEDFKDLTYFYDALKNSPIIPISGLWALLAKLPQEKIDSDEDLSWYFNEALYYVNSPSKLLEESGIPELEEKIREIIKKEKIAILKKKIKNLILSNLKKKEFEINDQKLELKMALKLYTLDKEKLEELKNSLQLLSNKIPQDYIRIPKYLEFFKDIKKEIEEELENLKMILIRKINNIGFFERLFGANNFFRKLFEEVEYKILHLINKLRDEALKKIYDDIENQIEALKKDHKKMWEELGIENEDIENFKMKLIDLIHDEVSKKKNTLKNEVREAKFEVLDITLFSNQVELFEEQLDNFSTELNTIHKNYETDIIRSIQNNIREIFISKIERNIEKIEKDKKSIEANLSQKEKELLKVEENLTNFKKIYYEIEKRLEEI